MSFYYWRVCYVGACLVPQLLSNGHSVKVLDTQWFGLNLSAHEKLEVVKADLSDLSLQQHMDESFDALIHLANVANDPGVDLNPGLSWEVNVLGARSICEACVKYGVGHVLFASSGSVYGVSDAPAVTEETPLDPISTYNKTKMIAERIFFSYGDQFKVHVVRPATVCGVSPRMRFDVSVNMFVGQAVFDGQITLFGGEQIRPNISMHDMVNVYLFLIDNPDADRGIQRGFRKYQALRSGRYG